MEVYLSRNHQTCLHLFPLSTGKFQNVFNQPNGPDGRSPRLVIERFISPLEELDRSLKGMALRSLSDVSQLNELVERVERMGERDLQILSGALRAEHVKCLADVYRTVQNISDYELIGGVTTDRALGQWLVKADQLKVRFPEEVLPYLDYGVIGNMYRDTHDGIFTTEGYVRKREPVPEMEKDVIFRVTLAIEDSAIRLNLPASDERLDQVKRELGVDDLCAARQLNFETGQDMAFLKDVLPMYPATFGEANALARCILEMARRDGELLKYCSVLEVKEPADFFEAYIIAKNINDYERVPEDMGEYGKQVLRRTGADDKLIDAIDGYMDFERFGTDSMAEDGVRRTEYGLVRRLSSPFHTQEAGQTMA